MTTIPYIPSVEPPLEKEKDSDPEMLVKAVGLKDDHGNEIYDIDVEPFASARTKAHWKPSREVFMKEVLRRYNSSEDKPSAREPGKNWTAKKCIKWLLQNPVTDENEIVKTRQEVASFKVDLIADKAAADQRVQFQWKTDIVYLRLIHCIVDDDTIKAAFERSFDALNRAELDGRKSDMQKENVWDMIASKMNDPTFAPETEVYADLHEDFKKTKDLFYHLMGNVGVITSTKVKDKFGEMKLRLTRIISDWSLSGQGCGAKMNEKEFGNIEVIERSGTDDRSNFLKKEDPPYLLYLWQKSYELNILGKVVQRINPAIAATSAQDFVSVYKKKRVVSPTNDDEVPIEMKVIKSMNDSAATYERTHIRQNIFDAEEKLFLLAQELERTTGEKGKALIKSRMEQLQKHVKTLYMESEKHN